MRNPPGSLWIAFQTFTVETKTTHNGAASVINHFLTPHLMISLLREMKVAVTLTSSNVGLL